MPTDGSPRPTGCDAGQVSAALSRCDGRLTVSRSHLSLASSQDDVPAAFKPLHAGSKAGPPRALFRRALVEVDELGPRPCSGPRWPWEDRRRQAMRRLAALADFDPYLLRRAALVKARPTRRDKAAAQLLNDATYYAWRAPLSEPSSTPP
jgi:hypothetical protein